MSLVGNNVLCVLVLRSFMTYVQQHFLCLFWSPFQCRKLLVFISGKDVNRSCTCTLLHVYKVLVYCAVCVAVLLF